MNLKDRYCCGDHKRTQQGVFAELLPYLYKLQVVYANTIQPCPKVHMLFIPYPYSKHKDTMLHTYILTSFF